MRRGIGGEGEERFVARVGLVNRVNEAVGEPGAGVEVGGQRDGFTVVQEGCAVVRLQIHVGLLEVRGAAFEQHVGLVEPAVLRLLRRLHAQMPFAGNEGPVAGIVQQLGEGGDIACQHTLVAGAHFSARRQALACLGHHAQSGQVWVVAGHQHRPGRGATGRGMKVQHQAAVGQQAVQVGGLNFAAQC